MIVSRKTGRAYAALRDTPNAKDYKVQDSYVLKAGPVTVASSGNGKFLGPVKNQTTLGACTGEGTTGMREFLYRRYFEYEKDKTVDPDKAVFSPLFTYWNERNLEGTVNIDNGAQPRSGVIAMNGIGVCLERSDPYNPALFTQRPSDASFAEALKYRAGAYHTVPSDVDVMKSVLASGYVFTQGISVYESFEDDYTARTGIMLLPDTTREQFMGGHCTLVYDFDDLHEWFICRNSWGTDWGADGDFYMPYKFVLAGLSNDMWMQHLGPAWQAKEVPAEPVVAPLSVEPEVEPAA